MATVTFDTRKFIRTLRTVGIPENQAEIIAEAFKEAHLEAELATKTDLRELAISARHPARRDDDGRHRRGRYPGQAAMKAAAQPSSTVA